MSFTWQGNGKSESESKTEAETTALEDSLSRTVQAEEGEALLSVDSCTGLPKLPIELVDSDDELDEASSVTSTLWYYNREIGKLTEVMSNIPSNDAFFSPRKKSVTFEEAPVLQPGNYLMRGEVDGSGSEKHSTAHSVAPFVHGMDKSKSDSYLILSEKERNKIAMAKSPHGFEKMKMHNSGRPSSLLKSSRSGSVYIHLQKSSPCLLRKSSFILGDRETELRRISAMPLSSENTRRCHSTGPSDCCDNCSLDHANNSQDDTEASLTDDDVYIPRCNFRLGRRSSFLYQSDSEDQEESGSTTSRVLSHGSSFSHVGDETYVTPFAQILATLRRLRSQYISLMGMPEGIRTVHSRPGWSSPSPDITPDKKAMSSDILRELDWCLMKLEGVSSTKSMGNMANEKFRRLLSRELTTLSEGSKEGAQVAEWVTNLTNLDGEVDRALVTMHDLLSPPTNIESSLTTSCPHDLTNEQGNSHTRPNTIIKSVMECDRIPVFGVDSIKMDKREMKRFAGGELMNWSLDIFHFNTVSGGNPLICATYIAFKRRNIFSKFKILPRMFIKYISSIQNLYHSSNPYHNAIHASDVFLSADHLLRTNTLNGVFTDLEVLATLVAAAVHDVDHPGVTNQFLIAVGNDLALLYNDKSVLENHHVATAFKTLQKPDSNFLEGFETSQRLAFRRIVIDLVLATDMSKHIEHLAEIKTLLEAKHVANDGILVLDEYSERLAVLQCLIHCSDLSNPTKSRDLATRWTQRIMGEFFLQGDKEKQLNIPVTAVGDRNNVSVAKCQISFIDFIVLPLWEMWAELVYPAGQEILNNITSIREYWASSEDDTLPSADVHNLASQPEDVCAMNPDDSLATESKDELPAKSQDGDESAAKSQDGDESAAKSRDGDESPAKSHEGDESPAKSHEGDESAAKSRDGDESPAKSQDGGESAAKSQDGDESPAKSQDRDDLDKTNRDESGIKLGDHSAALSVTHSATKSGGKLSTESGKQSTTKLKHDHSNGGKKLKKKLFNRNADKTSFREQETSSARDRRTSYKDCCKTSMSKPIGKIKKPAVP